MDGVTGVQTYPLKTNTNPTQTIQPTIQFLQELVSSLTMLENTSSAVSGSLSDTTSEPWPGVLLPLELLGVITSDSETSMVGAAQTNTGVRLNQNVSQSSTDGLGALVDQASAVYHVPSSLIRGVIQQESSNNPNSVSSAGAMGLMQLMPENVKALGVTNPFDPVQNVMAGTQLLAGLLSRYNGNQSLALAAYNAGAGAVEKYNGIPPYPETQQYVQKVLHYAGQYAASTNS